jgi:hypothetical protein
MDESRNMEIEGVNKRKRKRKFTLCSGKENAGHSGELLRGKS